MDRQVPRYWRETNRDDSSNQRPDLTRNVNKAAQRRPVRDVSDIRPVATTRLKYSEPSRLKSFTGLFRGARSSSSFVRRKGLWALHRLMPPFRQPKQVWKIATAFVSLGLIAIVLFAAISPAAAAVTVGTSTANTATQYSQQRKTWYDGTRYWVAFYDGTQIDFYYSANGSTWTQNTNATIVISVGDFSIDADSSHAFIAESTGGTLEARSATSYPSTSFSWSAATTIDTNFIESQPSITRDSNNKVWVGFEVTTCFPAGTKITMANGKTKDIKDIKLGDEVQSYDTQKGHIVTEKVYQLFKHLTSTYYLIKTKDSQVFATADHPFYVGDGQYKKVIDLKVGDNLYTLSGGHIKAGVIESITKIEKPVIVYNFSVDNLHNYFADNFLVHNKPASGTDSEAIQSTNANDITAWQTKTVFPSSISGGISDTLASIGSGNMVAAWNDNGNIYSGKYTSGVGWDSAKTPLAAGQNAAQSGTPITSNAAAREAYLSYINSTGNTMFRKYEGSSGNSSAAIGSSLGAIPAGTGHDLVRDSNGNIYVAVNTGSACEILKSTNNGSSFSEIDPTHHPACSGAGHNELALAIGSDNSLHLVYPESSNGNLKYVKVTSDTYGAIETITLPLVMYIGYGLDIAVDSNNVPHIAVSYQFGSPGAASYVVYDNRVGGSWNTAVTIETTSPSTSNFGSASISFVNDIPIISYLDFAQSTGLKAAIGNANNATSFSLTAIDATINKTTGQEGSSIAVDPAGNTWVAYIDGTTNYVTLLKHNAGDAWSTWQTAVTDSKVGSEPSLAVAGNMLYVLYKNSTGAIAQDVYNSDTASWGGENVIQSGTTLQNAHVRWALNADYQNAPLGYLYSDGTNIYYNQTGVWRAPVTLDNGTTNAYTSISRNTGTNDLYIFWERGNSVFYKKCVSPYLAANCDASATTKYTGASTVAWVSSGATYGGSCSETLPLVWTEGTASPYNVKYDSIGAGNCPPAAPALSSPSPGQASVSFAPQFQLKTTDQESDYLNYQVNICNNSSCSSVKHSVCQISGGTGAPSCGTVGQTGWSGQDANGGTAYTGNSSLAGSTTAAYTYQFSDLSACTQYWWEGYALDPGGSNTWSPVSAIQSFTTNCPPSAPTLTQPSGGQAGVSTTPEMRFYSTDQDNDSLEYKILICSSADTTCSSPLQTITQTSSQVGWSSQNQSTGGVPSSAYSGGQTAVYKVQTALSANTQYNWQVFAIDPNGTNIYGTGSTIQSFTTATAGKPQINIHPQGGDIKIYSGTSIGG